MPQKRRLNKKPVKKRNELKQRRSVVSAHAFEGTTRVSATLAKNRFGSVLDKVMQGRDVIITRHNAPKAIVTSVERFNALAKASSPNLHALSAEFDARLARMQTADARAVMQAAFDASPAALGRAALKAARLR